MREVEEMSWLEGRGLFVSSSRSVLASDLANILLVGHFLSGGLTMDGKSRSNYSRYIIEY